MKIEVRFRGMEPSEALREHTLRRIRVHLDRFGHEVTAALVRIGDTNGPKGGIDKRCQVTVRGPRLGALTIEELSGDFYGAVDGAAERLGHVVGRHVERARAIPSES